MEISNNKLTLKLLINKKSDKVLFGEASKDLVDFIFSLLALPLGIIAKLLKKDDMVGSLGEVYHSLSKLNNTYILSSGHVYSLLNPPLASTSNPKTNFLLPSSTYLSNHQDKKDRTLYLCSYKVPKCKSFLKRSSRSRSRSFRTSFCSYVSEVNGVTCPSCGSELNRLANFVGPKSDASTVVEVGGDGEGYVTGVVTYSVMDDLTVVPMSTISSIALLNKFQIKDLGSLEEITVNIGFEEGLNLLKASLETKTVLTNVFLKKNHASNDNI
ncbi:hypothetical protein FCM35_KLT18056 [Carex littledalei]|uniref:DUF674 domain-containing protein n=1 Tax=Carex littledalei TaxID=544730 RepID=A0A833VYE5_9POAL|nr:hypothetical protein FCM35_KLT18056 [Carex littledalei]